PWKKELTIEKELVTQTDAFLFPQVPDFKPLTFLEIQNPQLSPDNGKIIYTIPLPEEEAGIWVMDISDFLFNLSREPRQIAKSYPDLDFSKANFLWSPDSRQIMAELSNAVYYLLDSNQLNSNLSDYSAKVSETLKRWQNEATLRQNAKMKKIPETMQQILEQSANEINFSPDGSKILYVATASAVIPEKIIPPVMAASTQREQRTLEPNKTYVYDLKEDKNFLIPYTLLPSFTPTPAKKAVAQKKSPTPTPTLILGSHPKWFPTNRHLYWIENEKVFACDYDGTNQTIIYSGPFISPFVFAAPGANRLVILSQTNIDQNTKPNLYSVNLR
ncbi:MAG: hypothetical protein M1514_02005, partial [Patescibacteria group bacterium]|nr:hypothetical protein [Patescibacteria group bacterium]